MKRHPKVDKNHIYVLVNGYVLKFIFTIPSRPAEPNTPLL